VLLETSETADLEQVELPVVSQQFDIALYNDDNNFQAYFESIEVHHYILHYSRLGDQLVCSSKFVKMIFTQRTSACRVHGEIERFVSSFSDWSTAINRW
jgi:hypothetical protein